MKTNKIPGLSQTEARGPMRPESVLRSRLPGRYRRREERDEFSPNTEINLPKEAKHFFFLMMMIFFFFFFETYQYVQLFTYVQYPLILGLFVDLLSSHYWAQVTEL